MEKKLCFALFGSDSKNITEARVNELIEALLNKSADVRIEQFYFDSFTKGLRQPSIERIKTFKTLDFQVDYVISIGGDGTFLKAASAVGDKQIPIIGINMGRLGFLANILPDDMKPMIEDIYSGRFKLEDRTVIQLETDGKALDIDPFALNDIAILKRDMAAMISICVSINDDFLTSYLADGLVISTPTGSTAYSLSIGGPIMVPLSDTLSLTAVAPHSLNIRPIVINSNSVIKVQVESRSHNFLVAVDGRSATMNEGTILTIHKAPYKIRMVKPIHQHFFDTLREKMMWGADTRQLCKK